MAKVKREPREDYAPLPPGASPEEREAQLIAIAYNLVEERLMNGTASSQETVHFLKMGSSRQREEIEKLRQENEFLRKKSAAIQSDLEREDIAARAIEAMRSYAPPTQEAEEYEEFEDPYLY